MAKRVFMEEGLDNWGLGGGIKMSRQELIADARAQYIRAENIRKQNEQLIAKNNKLRTRIAELERELRFKTLQWEGVKDMLAHEGAERDRYRSSLEEIRDYCNGYKGEKILKRPQQIANTALKDGQDEG